MKSRSFLSNLFNKIANNGIKFSTNSDEAEYFKNTNIMVLAFFVGCLLTIPTKLYQNYDFYFYMIWLDPLLYTIAFLLINQGKVYLGAVTACFTANTLVLINSILMGSEANIHYFFWGLILCPIPLFRNHKKATAFFYLYPAIAVYLIQNKIIPTGFIEIKSNYFTNTTPIAACAIEIIVLAYFIMNSIEKRQKIIVDQQLEIANGVKYKGIAQLASGIAHEINNPLAIVHGNLSLIETMLTKENVDRQKTSLLITKAQNAITRASIIIKGLRNMSDDTNGENIEPHNINEIVQMACNVCKLELESMGIELIFNSNEDLPQVLCMPKQLSQAILNLIQNSKDAIVGQANPWIKIQIVAHENILKIFVIDSGNGIPKEIANKIMEPFFTTKKAGVGAGLGLSISRKLIEKQNGKLTLMNDQENTSFLITLPKAS